LTRRLVVDVMNVIGSRADRWWNDPDRAVRTMTKTLDEFAAASGESVTAVLDKDPGSLPEVRDIEVVVARRKGRNAADYEIEQIVAQADDPSSLTVVTSDKRLVESVRSHGAKVTGAGAFRRRLDSIAR
jgi:predicted RNA-binding protein with PIN domain